MFVAVVVVRHPLFVNADKYTQDTDHDDERRKKMASMMMVTMTTMMLVMMMIVIHLSLLIPCS